MVQLHKKLDVFISCRFIYRGYLRNERPLKCHMPVAEIELDPHSDITRYMYPCVVKVSSNVN